MKIKEMPGFGRRGHIVEDLDPNISYKDWMELGKLHLDDLVTVFVDTKLDSKRFGQLVRYWGMEQATNTYLMLKKYGFKSQKDLEHILIDWDNKSHLIDKEDKDWLWFHLRVFDHDSTAIRVCSHKDEEGNAKGIFASGELDWHSNESARLHFASGVALMGAQSMKGSATGFMQTADWYEDQKESMKNELDAMIIVHEFHEGLINPDSDEEDQKELDMYTKFNQCPETIELPLVRLSPGGIRGLNVGNNTIDRVKGLTKKESDEFWIWLKSELYVEEYMYDHWYQSDSDFVVFDQAITQHRRLGHFQDENGKWTMGDRVALRMQMDFYPLLKYLDREPYNPWIHEPWHSDFIPIDKEMKQYLDDPRCYPEREGEELESIFS